MRVRFAQRMREAMADLKYSLASLLIFVLAYGVLSNYFCSIYPRMRVITPPLQEVASSFTNIALTGELEEHAMITLTRVIQGITIGIPLGVLVGFLMAWYERVDHYLDPIYNLLRPVPPLAFVTLFILWFGIGEFPKVLLIFYAVFMATLIPTYHGVKDIPDVYIKAARVLGADRKLLLRKVILPAATPRILAGFRVSVMLAWGTVVAAELIASLRGLGYLIIDSQRILSTSLVIVGILVLALFGFIMDGIVVLSMHRLTGWMKRVAL